MFCGLLFVLLISSATVPGRASEEDIPCEGDACLVPEAGSVLLQSHRDARRNVDTDDPDDSPDDEDDDEHLYDNNSVTEDELKTYNDLTLAFPIALQNVSNFTGLLTTPNVSHGNVHHQFGDGTADLNLLFSKVEGLYQILHGLPNGSDYCPFNDFTKIRRCIGITMCLLQKGTPHVVPLEVYTLYVELFARFETITWDLVEEALENEGASIKQEDYQIPNVTLCDWTDHPGELELLQPSSAQSESGDVSATLAVAATLQRAYEASHTIFDSHYANSSMASTVEKLETAWRPVCESLGCDHTNYWDLLAASHGHSRAMVEMNAPARYIHSQVRARVLLENRVQRFLGVHGDDFAQRAYRQEDVQPAHEESMHSYFDKSRATLKRHTTEFVHSLDHESIDRVTRLVDGDRLEAFFNKFDEGSSEPSFLDTDDELSEDDVISDTHDAELAVEDGALAETGADIGTEESRLWRRRRRDRRRCRRRFWKKVGCAVVSVVNAVAGFIADLFECVGQCKTLVATGYCKKFPAATSNFGVGVGFTMSGGNLQTILSGNPQPSIALSISVVFGAVPGTPITGGVRVGVGIGGGVSCSGSGCSVGISVGATTSAIWPTTGGACNFGKEILSFKCMKAAGLAISLFCCRFNVITGAEDCR